MKQFWLVLFFVCCLIPKESLRGADGEESAERAVAEKTADNWLKLVDDHKYRQSWKELAASLQKTVPEDRWRQVMGTVRDALGELDGRKVSKIKFREKLPGLPDGDYAIVQFDTAFEGKTDAVEIVYLESQSENSWKVCGYYVK
jgi:uncharacterized protein DUF4019